MNIENKELLIAAIKDYEPYNNSQKKLLIALLNICVDNSVTTSVSSLSKLVGFTRAMVYKSLEALQQDGAIKKANIKQARVSTFELNQTKMRHLAEVYIKKQEFLKTKQPSA